MFRHGVIAFIVLIGWLCASAHGQGELVIVKDDGEQYHMPGCEVVRDGKGVVAMTRAQAESRGYKQHPACDPSRPEASKTLSPRRSSPAPPVHVFVDAGKFYHRENCAKLAKNPTRMALEDAGKKYWPCSTCRPPVRKKSDAPAVRIRRGP